MTNEQKKQIDSMSHYDLCKMWRFATSYEPLLQLEVGVYFKKRLFNDLGGFTPEISKQLG